MAKAAALTTVGVLGLLAALDPPFTYAEPGHGVHPVTLTVTKTVRERYQGWSARTWARHAVRNRRALNALRARDRLLAAQRRHRFAYTVRYGLELARVVYGVDQTRRAFCESRMDPYAAEGHGPLGLLQFQPSTWRSTPFGAFSIFDPIAQSLAGGWMVSHGRSGEWACGL